jgi:uncharacterized protein (DUF58 family)
MRPTRLLGALVGFAVALLLVARTTGAGWTIVVVCCVGAAVIIGAVWPAIAIRRVTVAIDAPGDGVAVHPLEITVAVDGTRSPVRIRLTNPPSGWTAVATPARGELAAVPPARGVIETVVIDIHAGAPLGLMWFRRRLTIALPRPIEVAPYAVEEPLAASALAARAGGEAVRSLREYVRGDAARLVHWPSTARRGQLIVKELEEPDRPGLVIQADLSDPHFAEDVARRAMGAAVGGLRAGLDVTLLTAEATGKQGGRVRTPIEAGRRLARAVAGPPADGPVPEGAIVLRLGSGDR